MKKFMVLLKKEIKELLTPQMFVPLIITILVFVFIGNVVGNESEKAQARQTTTVLDMDDSQTSTSVINMLIADNFNVTLFKDKTINEVTDYAREKNINSIIVIPRGFGEGITNGEHVKINIYNIIKNFSITGTLGATSANIAANSINQYISNRMIEQKLPGTDPSGLKNPVGINNYVDIAEKRANVNPEEVIGFISSQTFFIPIIMFFIILFASQMIAVAIASEKENKTLETLLSTPVSRISLVSTKMIAAGIISLSAAAVYMIGMRYYMNGLMSGMGADTSNMQAGNALKQLGLAFSTTDYILLGLSLFFSILIALSISIILGAFAEDVKKVQGLVAPIMVMIMIPYFLVMFTDLNSVSPILKLFVYAIPFSQPFLVAPNLFLNNYSLIFYGIIYEVVVFIIFAYIATRIFSTDKILTMKLNFKKKSSLFKTHK